LYQNADRLPSNGADRESFKHLSVFRVPWGGTVGEGAQRSLDKKSTSGVQSESSSKKTKRAEQKKDYQTEKSPSCNPGIAKKSELTISYRVIGEKRSIGGVQDRNAILKVTRGTIIKRESVGGGGVIRGERGKYQERIRRKENLAH